jgi:hypothetical protein
MGVVSLVCAVRLAAFSTFKTGKAVQFDGAVELETADFALERVCASLLVRMRVRMHRPGAMPVAMGVNQIAAL